MEMNGSGWDYDRIAILSIDLYKIVKTAGSSYVKPSSIYMSNLNIQNGGKDNKCGCSCITALLYLAKIKPCKTKSYEKTLLQ